MSTRRTMASTLETRTNQKALLYIHSNNTNEFLELVRTRSIDPNYRDENAIPLLHHAIIEKNVDIVEGLLELEAMYRE